MQYPIIDLITDAYINNGWTGLELTEGKNLFDYRTYPTFISGNMICTNNNDGTFIINGQNSSDTFFNLFRQFSDNPLESNRYKLTGTPIGGSNSTYYMYIRPSYSNDYGNGVIFTDSVVGGSIYIKANYICDNLIFRPMIRYATIEEDTFEPYKPPTTDISNRLKLPLPHYFPHPVIDALQRAAAGTQTADDTEILQHYLTPLGIGGI